LEVDGRLEVCAGLPPDSFDACLCARAGWDEVVGIEKTAEYAAIARKRIRSAAV
jgi:hypothetical protein